MFTSRAGISTCTQINVSIEKNRNKNLSGLLFSWFVSWWLRVTVPLRPLSRFRSTAVELDEEWIIMACIHAWSELKKHAFSAAAPLEGNGWISTQCWLLYKPVRWIFSLAVWSKSACRFVSRWSDYSFTLVFFSKTSLETGKDFHLQVRWEMEGEWGRGEDAASVLLRGSKGRVRG